MKNKNTTTKADKINQDNKVQKISNPWIAPATDAIVEEKKAKVKPIKKSVKKAASKKEVEVAEDMNQTCDEPICCCENALAEWPCDCNKRYGLDEDLDFREEVIKETLDYIRDIKENKKDTLFAKIKNFILNLFK